jgi:sugar O-acyltransferase (sialic acid O-acetyltransferase NeuD family)
VLDLVILGAGGTTREILAWMDEFNADTPRYRCVAVLDDNPAKLGTMCGGVPVAGPLQAVDRWPAARVVDALGGPTSFRRRPEIIARTGVADDRFETLVHPRAYVSSRTVLGPGCLVFPHVTIGAGVTLGAHVTILPNAVVNHDTQVGDYTIIASNVGVSGHVAVGRTCYLGTGSLLIQDVIVGDRAMIGMGSVVRDTVAPDSVVAGNPARVIR